MSKIVVVALFTAKEGKVEEPVGDPAMGRLQL